MPTSGTPRRTVRVPSVDWNLAHAAAAARGVTVSEVIREALRELIEDSPTREVRE